MIDDRCDNAIAEVVCLVILMITLMYYANTIYAKGRKPCYVTHNGRQLILSVYLVLRCCQLRGFLFAEQLPRRKFADWLFDFSD